MSVKKKTGEPESNSASIARQFRQHAGLPERTSDEPTNPEDASELFIADEPEGGYNQGKLESPSEGDGEEFVKGDSLLVVEAAEAAAVAEGGDPEDAVIDNEAEEIVAADAGAKVQD